MMIIIDHNGDDFETLRLTFSAPKEGNFNLKILSFIFIHFIMILNKEPSYIYSTSFYCLRLQSLNFIYKNLWKNIIITYYNKIWVFPNSDSCFKCNSCFLPSGGMPKVQATGATCSFMRSSSVAQHHALTWTC